MNEVEGLLARNEIKFLGEVMNYTAVINEDRDVMAKIALAKQFRKCLDGHAPGLRGELFRST